MTRVFKFLFVVFVYSILFTITNMFLPFSQTFKEVNAGADPFSAVYLLLNGAFICFTMCFIAYNASWRGMKLAAGIIGVIFFIVSFMTQIETLFFISAFTVLTKADVIMIMAAMLPSIVSAALLSVKFFARKEMSGDKAASIVFKPLIPRILVLGVLYTVLYFLFGYFVAWQFEALRVFYSGSAENVGFWGQLMSNFRNNAIIYPFQLLRGIMFTFGVLPLLYMLREKKAIFVISVCLVYLCTAIVLIIPNVLFPDDVRWAHFIEMSSSMFFFGIIAGYVLGYR